MKKKKQLNILKKKSKYLDDDVFEELKSDYENLVEEQEKEIGNLKNELRKHKTNLSDIFDVLTFEQRYLLYQTVSR